MGLGSELGLGFGSRRGDHAAVGAVGEAAAGVGPPAQVEAGHADEGATGVGALVRVRDRVRVRVRDRVRVRVRV